MLLSNRRSKCAEISLSLSHVTWLSAVKKGSVKSNGVISWSIFSKLSKDRYVKNQANEVRQLPVTINYLLTLT